MGWVLIRMTNMGSLCFLFLILKSDAMDSLFKVLSHGFVARKLSEKGA